MHCCNNALPTLLQWIDFVKRENFSASVCELLKGLESQEIFPTGAEKYVAS